jgi:hypothetical protein
MLNAKKIIMASENKDLILGLIRDNLINYQLVSGLNALGLNADHYNLYLDDTIFSLMGFEEDKYSEMVYQKIYMGLAEKVKTIDFSISREKLDALAFEIYSELMVAKEIKRDTN